MFLTDRTRFLFAPLCAILLLFASCPSTPSPEKKSEGGKDGGKGQDLELVQSPRSDNAQRLMDYLAEMYGKVIISGQMDTAWSNNGQNDMITRVFTDTGKYPAVKGFDMMEMPYNWTNWGRQQIDEAIEWWDGKNRVNNASVAATKLLPEQPDIHGIVTFCWHWRRPAKTGTDLKFYTNETNFRIPWKNGKLDTKSGYFKELKADMDTAAALFKLLKDKDIPVLWRPLHEASGGWFWWGAYDGNITKENAAARYKALWEYMYDYFTRVKGLDNLIWVWNGQDADWFPNPISVDIAGYDHYTNSETPTQARDYAGEQWKNRFNQTRSMIPDEIRSQMIVALTENGTIPDPDKCFADNAMWSWFCTWNDNQSNKWLTDNPWNPDWEPTSKTEASSYKGNFWAGEYHNTADHKNKVYHHEKVITLDKLPDLTKYRLE